MVSSDRMTRSGMLSLGVHQMAIVVIACGDHQPVVSLQLPEAMNVTA
jgi:hypothetical protein